MKWNGRMTDVILSCRVCGCVIGLHVSVYSWESIVRDHALPNHCKEEMTWRYIE